MVTSAAVAPVFFGAAVVDGVVWPQATEAATASETDVRVRRNL